MNDVYSRKPLRPLNKKCPPGYIERGGICVLDTRRNMMSSNQQSSTSPPIPPIPPIPPKPPKPPTPPPKPPPGPEPSGKTKKKIPYKEIIGGTAVAGAVGAAIYKRDAIVDMGRSARRSAQRVINRNNAKKFDGEPSEMGRLLDELEAGEGEGFEMQTLRRTPTQPPPRPSTTNQQLRFRQPRGDSQVSVQRPSIRGNANSRSGMDPAKSFKETLARRQKEQLKRQAEMDAEQRQPLIDQRATPNATEKTPLIEKSGDDGTFPMQKGDGGGGGGKTESRGDMGKRYRAARSSKKISKSNKKLESDMKLEDLKAKQRTALDKKVNAKNQAEEIDVNKLNKEIEELGKKIEEQEKMVDDMFPEDEVGVETGDFGGVKIDDAGELQEKTSLANQVKAEKLAKEEAQAAKEEAQAAKEAAEKYRAKQAKGGLDAGAEEDAVLEPIAQDELDTIPIQGEGAVEVGEAGAVESGEAGAIEIGAEASEIGAVEVGGATSLIGEIAVTTGGEVTTAAILGGEVAAGDIAMFIAGGVASNLLVGAAIYGLFVGGEAIYDAVTTSDKEYSDQRNTELGSHEMDRREVSYKLQELGAVRDIYEKKVNQGYSVSNKDPKAIAQHESDIAMLNALQTNIDSLNESFKNDIPVYAVVENGFSVDGLSGADKKEYDRLVERVSDAQDDVNYGGAASKAENQKRLDNRQRKLDAFISQNSTSDVASGFVNKPTDEEMKGIMDDYEKYGTDAFGNLSPEQLEVLGINQAIRDTSEQRLVDAENLEVTEPTDEEADAYWEQERKEWAAEDAAQRAKENDESGSDYNKKRAAYFSDHPEEVAAMENEQQETAEPSHQDDARGLAQTEETE